MALTRRRSSTLACRIRPITRRPVGLIWRRRRCWPGCPGRLQYDPVTNKPAALARQKQVLQQMVIDGYISSAEAVEAEDEAASPGFIKPGHPINLIPADSDY